LQRLMSVAGAGFLADWFDEYWRQSAADGVGRQSSRSGHPAGEIKTIAAIL